MDTNDVEYVWNENFSLNCAPEDGVGRRSGRMMDRMRVKREGSAKRTWTFGSMSSGSVGSSEDDSSATTTRQDEFNLKNSKASTAARRSRLAAAMHTPSSRWRDTITRARGEKMRKTPSMPRMKRSQTLGTLIAKNYDAIQKKPSLDADEG
eukprot:CAMPEP_0185851516 /NCGR_PEP_ID=MMETSP1354-20130828/10159_1 /TAXON_ID=708628 /ORGANISM="Erythrolobus madagascarensis, Strain CCMP3276" /LENGTH=150 /DNA_ID=CAMNT_0028552517 /DNA_START=1 /DNA_END=453 /DNA_ORIENTATION=+